MLEAQRSATEAQAREADAETKMEALQTAEQNQRQSDAARSGVVAESSVHALENKMQETRRQQKKEAAAVQEARQAAVEAQTREAAAENRVQALKSEKQAADQRQRKAALDAQQARQAGAKARDGETAAVHELQRLRRERQTHATKQARNDAATSTNSDDKAAETMRQVQRLKGLLDDSQQRRLYLMFVMLACSALTCIIGFLIGKHTKNTQPLGLEEPLLSPPDLHRAESPDDELDGALSAAQLAASQQASQALASRQLGREAANRHVGNVVAKPEPKKQEDLLPSGAGAQIAALPALASQSKAGRDGASPQLSSRDLPSDAPAARCQATASTVGGSDSLAARDAQPPVQAQMPSDREIAVRHTPRASSGPQLPATRTTAVSTAAAVEAAQLGGFRGGQQQLSSAGGGSVNIPVGPGLRLAVVQSPPSL